MRVSRHPTSETKHISIFDVASNVCIRHQEDKSVDCVGPGICAAFCQSASAGHSLLPRYHRVASPDMVPGETHSVPTGIQGPGIARRYGLLSTQLHHGPVSATRGVVHIPVKNVTPPLVDGTRSFNATDLVPRFATCIHLIVVFKVLRRVS